MRGMVGAREILEPRDCCARHRMTCCTLQLRLGPGVVERLRTMWTSYSASIAADDSGLHSPR
jgi:hypothetical protein